MVGWKDTTNQDITYFYYKIYFWLTQAHEDIFLWPPLLLEEVEIVLNDLHQPLLGLLRIKTFYVSLLVEKGCSVKGLSRRKFGKIV